ncbi:hypothetical protein BH10PSE4_BH10PSE4_03610 [soil metagenome]
MIRIRKIGFKSAKVLAAVVTLTLGACDSGEEGWRPAPATPDAEQASPQAGYLKPPQVLSATRQAGGMVLSGQAAPKSSVRLGAPTGETLTGQADETGRWRIVAPQAAEPRLYGLSMTLQGRTVQAQGYLMITPSGMAVLLRAGAGAEVMAQASSSPRMLAIDYDRSGGGVISGVAAPGAGLGVRVDRTTRGEGKADDAGRFALSLNQALETGPRTIQVAGEGGEQQIVLEVSPPRPPSGGPVHSTLTPLGWRVDWVTPGGGVQTTQLLEGAQ